MYSFFVKSIAKKRAVENKNRVSKKYTNLKFKYFIIKYILYFYFSIDYYTFQGFFKIYFDKIINILHCFQVSNWCTFLGQAAYS